MFYWTGYLNPKYILNVWKKIFCQIGFSIISKSMYRGAYSMVKPVSFLTQIFRYGNSDGPILRAKLKISSKVKILKNAFKKNMGINDKKI